MNIDFSRHVLSNGLRLIFHKDISTPFAVINMLYDVGARDEDPERTGFAHLFEHLMFGGSINIGSFDTPLQKAGGESNAFTTNDITNYYITVPADNIETALWLESDRMLQLDFSPKLLDVQRKVVIEEFHQRYLNQPYGDISLLFRPLCYKVHPYQWATIGKDISHIEGATLHDVKEFFYKHYNPSNAVLVIAGNFDEDYIVELSEKWFGNIRRPHSYKRSLPQEPIQTEARRLEVERGVPQDTMLISFPMCNRYHRDYYTYDFLTDILSQGQSARLTQTLVKQNQLFSDIEAYISGSLDEGQLIIRGDLLPETSFDKAEQAILEQLEILKTNPVPENEMEKIMNQIETSHVFQHIRILNKAINLAAYEMLGDADMINHEDEKYKNITASDIIRVSRQTFAHEKSSTLLYKSTQQK